MSPIRSRLGPFDGGSSSASPPTPPAPSSSTSNPSTRVRLYQGGTTDQHQLRFVPPLVAGHTTLPSQRQDSHIRVPQVSHGQLGEDLYTFMHAMGGVHVPRQPAPQTSRPHPRHMGNQATSSVRGTSETLFDHDAGQQPSLGDSSNDILRYLNEGKDDSAEHRHAIRTVCGGRSYDRLDVFLLEFLLTPFLHRLAPLPIEKVELSRPTSSHRNNDITHKYKNDSHSSLSTEKCHIFRGLSGFWYISAYTLSLPSGIDVSLVYTDNRLRMFPFMRSSCLGMEWDRTGSGKYGGAGRDAYISP